MYDDYFERLFNEEREPFPNFLNQLDSYSPNNFSKLELPPENEHLLSKLEFDEYNSHSISSSLKDNSEEEKSYREVRDVSNIVSGWEEVKEDSSSADKESDSVKEAQDTGKSKSKRTTKVQRKGTQPGEGRRETRAEKNRKYARESRERKKKYVEELEQQVEALRTEVEVCKARLKHYELIEKFKNALGYEFYDRMRNVNKQLHESQTPAEKEELMLSARKVINQTLEDQTNALKLVTKILVDVCLPIPLRVSIWLANKKTETMSAKTIAEIMNPVITVEQAQAAIDYERKTDPDHKRRKDFQEFIKDRSKAIKDSLKQIIQHQKDIANVFKTMMEYYNANLLSCYTPYIFEIYAKINTQLATRPEVQERDLDRLLTNLSLVENKDDVAKMECGAS